MIVWSIGSSTFTGGDIVVTATDMNQQRNLQFEEAICPMRPGTATLVFLRSIDNQGGLHSFPAFCDCGSPLASSCD